MVTSWSGHNFQLGGARTVSISGKSSHELTVPALSGINVCGELITRTSPFFDCVPNLNRRASHNPWAIPNAMQNGSLQLYQFHNGEKHPLIAGTDYELANADFAGINFLKPEKFENNNAYMDYQIKYQRVDTIAVNEQGEIRLFCGRESLVCARIPLLPQGWEGICRIYCHRNNILSDDNLLPIADRKHARLLNYEIKDALEDRMPDDWFGTDTPPHPDACQLFTNHLDYRRAVAYSPTQAETLCNRVRSQKEFSLVYFGDSVTMGGDVDNDRRFPRRLNDWLKQQYPNVKFNCPNAAIGGTNSCYGRERFVNDVLKFKPDAVTIMFPLNDNGIDDATFLNNHRYFVEELRKINAIPIFMTSNAMTATWMKGFDHSIDRLRKFCAEEQIIMLDVYQLWMDMRNYGIPYETMLANGINHPDNISAGMFFEALKNLFSTH